MATTGTSQVKRNRDESPIGPDCKFTETGPKGHELRLSRVNLFTLLSLWMELFPRNKPKNAEQSTGRKCTKQDGKNIQAKVTGLVVVQGRKVMGLHCSSAEQHVGQVAVIRHGPRLKGCDLYFSRKPYSTCMKMIVYVKCCFKSPPLSPPLADVNVVSYWPGDPELSLPLLNDAAGVKDSAADEDPAGVKQPAVDEDIAGVEQPAATGDNHPAILDAIAAERLKPSSQLHVYYPLASEMQQVAEKTSKASDFLKQVGRERREDLFDNQQQRSLERLRTAFIVRDEDQHQYILRKIGLENFSVEPYFSTLRKHMEDLIDVLASVASSVPDLQQGYGFYERDLSQDHSQGLSQDVARHCMIQAQLLVYRTEDHKVGVGAVIWAEEKSGRCDGTGGMYLVGCGYNGYAGGSAYSAFPQMGSEEKDPWKKKYKYIIHAEQNVLIFRSAEIKEDEKTMLFVTKCPCDECVPLIVGAGIKQVYTTDRDSGKDKGDLSYLTFVQQQDVQKFIWQKKP
ncbi:cytidine and dCMP deaminase domain-containing protein 1-like [Conger conger]|uniref:cytidine and dCMP deaminase domain-containing protein 1-like n=1 Tax=Conger conger TaxID=82655 RepID=UPI002A5AB2F0|nr:cytidine and dCMP deaminase domain-containing protein 1-like [Conger conger]